LNEETLRLEAATVSRAFCTGVKPVYRLTTQLGRAIRATGNHKFRTFEGWRRLDELHPGDYLAIPRLLPSPEAEQTMSDAELALLGHQNVSRERAARVAEAVGSRKIARLAESHVYWDPIVSIEAAGEEEVFDLTVPGPHNFIANNIIAHNSIEQDADIVMFIYRDEYYNPDTTERPNIAEVNVAKHRNGPTGTIDLYWHGKLATFRNLQRQEITL
jgi:replicative DNA helicase